MGANVVQIKNAVTITWDGVQQRLAPGTILDSPAAAGSNLLQTIGAANYASLGAQQTGGAPGVDDGQRNANVRVGGEPYNAGQVG
jgi:hypothetical protein